MKIFPNLAQSLIQVASNITPKITPKNLLNFPFFIASRGSRLDMKYPEENLGSIFKLRSTESHYGLNALGNPKISDGRNL